MSKLIQIGQKQVGDGRPVYIIAEIGINHEGDLKKALRLVEAAAKAGADAVKFQTYITEKRAPEPSPLYGILKKCELPFKAFQEIKAYADSLGVEFFSTPFDVESLDYLESIDCPFYKIASFYLTDSELVPKIAATGKPSILSVGMSSLEEIQKAYNILTSRGAETILLHCITAYPMPETEAHLSAIYTLRSHFDTVIGQSDHTADIQVPLYAVAAGARVLEKHFRLKDDTACVDAPVSIDPDQMARLARECRRLEAILGSPDVKMRKIESQYEWLRRK